MLKKEHIVIISETPELLDYAFLNIAGNVNVSALISSSITENKYKLPVYDMQWLLKQNMERILIVIADNKEMNNIAKQLLANQLQLIKNWIPYWLYESCEIFPERMYQLLGGNKERFKQAMLELKKNKQIVMIHGNCQTHAARYYLRNNEEFSERYILVEMPQLWNAGHKGKYDLLIEINIYEYVDILITQNVAKNNRFGEYVSTDFIRTLLKPDCKIITISNLFFNGYYPQFIKNSKIDETALDSCVNRDGLRNYNGIIDYFVAQKVIEGKKVDEIIQIIMDEDLFDRKELYTFIFEGLEYSKRKEQDCDVKICEYIEEMLNKEILFTTTSHPCENLMVELCSRILKSLGINSDFVCLDGYLYSAVIPNTERLPIYPSIFKCLNLNKRYNGLLYRLPNGKKVNFREYMTVYIKTVFPTAK